MDYINEIPEILVETELHLCERKKIASDRSHYVFLYISRMLNTKKKF